MDIGEDYNKAPEMQDQQQLKIERKGQVRTNVLTYDEHAQSTKVDLLSGRHSIFLLHIPILEVVLCIPYILCITFVSRRSSAQKEQADSFVSLAALSIKPEAPQRFGRGIDTKTPNM